MRCACVLENTNVLMAEEVMAMYGSSKMTSFLLTQRGFSHALPEVEVSMANIRLRLLSSSCVSVTLSIRRASPFSYICQDDLLYILNIHSIPRLILQETI